MNHLKTSSTGAEIDSSFVNTLMISIIKFYNAEFSGLWGVAQRSPTDPLKWQVIWHFLLSLPATSFFLYSSIYQVLLITICILKTQGWYNNPWVPNYRNIHLKSLLGIIIQDHIGKIFFGAFRTNTMAKFSIRMFMDIWFDLTPIPLVITNFLTIWANG